MQYILTSKERPTSQKKGLVPKGGHCSEVHCPSGRRAGSEVRSVKVTLLTPFAQEERQRADLMARASNRSQEQLQWDEEVEDGKLSHRCLVEIEVFGPIVRSPVVPYRASTS